MKRFQDRLAVVTGACGGIGSACVDALLAEGAWVQAIDLRHDAVLLERWGGRVAFTEMDVADESCWGRLTEALAEASSLEVLINAAGISGLRNIEDADYAFWSRFQRVNSDSAFLAIHHLMPWLKAAGSAAIVNVGSTLALKPSGDLPAYSASKGALRNLTKSVALYCANRGYRIRCNSVHPGSTLTPMMEANLGETEEQRRRNLEMRMRSHPYSNALGRIALPDDVARAVLFLASEDAAFITGADLPVDGGATI